MKKRTTGLHELQKVFVDKNQTGRKDRKEKVKKLKTNPTKDKAGHNSKSKAAAIPGTRQTKEKGLEGNTGFIKSIEHKLKTLQDIQKEFEKKRNESELVRGKAYSEKAGEMAKIFDYFRQTLRRIVKIVEEHANGELHSDKLEELQNARGVVQQVSLGLLYLNTLL